MPLITTTENLLSGINDSLKALVEIAKWYHDSNQSEYVSCLAEEEETKDAEAKKAEPHEGTNEATFSAPTKGAQKQ